MKKSLEAREDESDMEWESDTLQGRGPRFRFTMQTAGLPTFGLRRLVAKPLSHVRLHCHQTYLGPTQDYKKPTQNIKQ